jgi:nicotinic acid mononucleotide adenylyltransferase
VHHLKLDDNFSDVSSTEVRRRIASAEPWEHLVPPGITARVREIYAG